MILVTGGAGYIGSHTVLELLENDKDVVVLDNLSNSCGTALKRIAELAKKEVVFIKGDIRDRKLLTELFEKYNIESVIHFAGLKAVGESNEMPLEYYENNVSGTISLCQVMAEFGVCNLVFSSSATVYGDPKKVPIEETDDVGNTTNPYGTSKYFVEKILFDLAKSDSRWKIALLRYFNPVGAHPSGLIGEDPSGIPNNLVPFVSQVAVGKLQELRVFGNDYSTPDGTGVRDYIHVVDLAKGHLKALNYLKDNSGCKAINLGTGQGYSVLEVIKTYESVSGRTINYSFADRREGDIAECFALPDLAYQLLNWRAEKPLKEMLEDSWNWQKNNPNGYRTEQ